MNATAKKGFYQIVLFVAGSGGIFFSGCIQTIEQEPIAQSTPLSPNILPKATSYIFQGKVVRGQQFEEQLPNGLLFQLSPQRLDDVGEAGWQIQIVSPENREQDYAQYANPPFRGTNMLQIFGWHFRNADNTGENDGSVNVPQRQRSFYFFLTEADFVDAEQLVHCIMWPSQCDGTDQIESRNDRYANIPRATGMLEISDIALGNLVKG